MNASALFFTYAAYALLQRHNSARIVYFVIFSLGAAGSVILLAVSGLGLGAFTDQLVRLP